MPARPSSTCTATTCRHAAARPRSQRSCGCSPRSRWPPPPYGRPSPGWCGQGWLVPVRLDQGAGYRLTRQAERRLSAAASRIYRRGIARVGRPMARPRHRPHRPSAATRPGPQRTRLPRLRLLRDAMWISPRASARGRRAARRGRGAGAALLGRARRRRGGQLAAGAWDLDGDRTQLCPLAGRRRVLVGDPGRERLTDEEAFTIRSRLVHEWRKFLFRDPSLPARAAARRAGRATPPPRSSTNRPAGSPPGRAVSSTPACWPPNPLSRRKVAVETSAKLP